MWIYATCGMGLCGATNPIELHLFSPRQCELLIELLTVIAHYHCTDRSLGLGHTVNFGRPWLPDSKCDYGLISLPYLDGPALERFNDEETDMTVECLWLIPIAKSERDYTKKNGLEALESKFEEYRFDYLDPARPSVV
jgi:hypothetical protein